MAQIRDNVFIGRGLTLQSGNNSISAVAEDRAGNDTTDSGHTVSLDASSDRGRN
ncbi:MAG: hypothetical protein JW889_06975 [Verrucomicrobia bacterium]|nr:hypothetical protein [Verrucomicrobiota bacterium]